MENCRHGLVGFPALFLAAFLQLFCMVSGTIFGDFLHCFGAFPVRFWWFSGTFWWDFRQFL
tara:strand:+ start:244 stop:426 length:183 start_codon:yes stop_codon:yes gene_type:complete